MDTDQVNKTYVLLGALLRHYRNASGLTQDDLSAHLNIDRKNISRIESGQKPVSVMRLLQICSIIGVDCGGLVSELMERLNHEG